MRQEPMKLKAGIMFDGYGPIDGYSGPFRKLDDNKVLYFDDRRNVYIQAKELYRMKGIK